MGIRNPASIKLVRRIAKAAITPTANQQIPIIPNSPIKDLTDITYDELLRVLPVMDFNGDCYDLLAHSFSKVSMKNIRIDNYPNNGMQAQTYETKSLDLRGNEKGSLKGDDFSLQVMKIDAPDSNGNLRPEYIQILFRRQRPGANMYDLFRGRFSADGSTQITGKEMGTLMARRFFGLLEHLNPIPASNP